MHSAAAVPKATVIIPYGFTLTENIDKTSDNAVAAVIAALIGNKASLFPLMSAWVSDEKRKIPIAGIIHEAMPDTEDFFSISFIKIAVFNKQQKSQRYDRHDKYTV